MRYQWSLCIILGVLLSTLSFSTTVEARRFPPPDITGNLSFASPPRLQQMSTLILTTKSHLDVSTQAELWLRLPVGVSAESDVRMPVYLPAGAEISQAFAVRFESPGTYPLQVSLYAGHLTRHFIVYVRVTHTGAQVSSTPLPGEPVQKMATRSRVIQRAPQQSVEVQGTVTYFDDNETALRPVRRILVELWEFNTGSDVLIDSTFTDNDGEYRFAQIDNVDPQDGGLRDLYISAVFENEALRLINIHEQVYVLSSDVVHDVPNGLIELDVSLDATHNRRGAGHIFNVIIDAHDFLVNQVSWERDPIPIIWPTNEGGSFYSYFTKGTLFFDEIHIVSADAWERITMLHEYGHSVMSAAYNNDFDRIPNGEYDQPHYVNTVSDPGFAMSEGWAEFMEAAVDDDALMLRGYVNRDLPNVEENAWYTGEVDGNGNNMDGNIVEGAVASILWDITDTSRSTDHTPGVDDDDADSLFPYAWQIMTEERPPDIRTLGERWKQRGLYYDATELIFASHGVPLRSNQPPTVAVLTPDTTDRLSPKLATVTWTASDPDGDPLTVDLYYDQDILAGNTFPMIRGLDGTITQYLWDTSSLSDGGYYVLVRVTDNRGASAEAYSRGKVFVDHTPLAAPVVHSATHPDPTQWVANASPDLTIESEVSEFSYLLDQTADTEPDTDPDLVGNHLSFQQLDDGIWWLHVRARDPLGYWTDVTHFKLQIHTQKPAVPANLRWLVEGAPVNRATVGQTLELVWEAVSDTSGIARYEIRVVSAQGGTVDAEVAGNVLRYAFVPGANGSYQAQIRAVNQAGTIGDWGPSVAIEISEPRPWDVNDDAVVDVLDLTIVALHFGEAITGSPDENPDVTGDGWVDILDLVSVGQHFGETYGLAAPAIVGAQAVFLLPNYPNPFNPETWIPFVMTAGGDVQITIYDLQGKIVRKLALGYLPAGVYVSKADAIYWDGRNEVGETVASGSYFYKIRVGTNTALRKMMVMR